MLTSSKRTEQTKMQHVMLGGRQSCISLSSTSSPKQKRLSVGFGANASVQIHNTATPPTTMQRRTDTRYDSPCGSASAASDLHDDATPGRRKSLHEALLMRLLTTPSNEPLFEHTEPTAGERMESQRTADDSFDSCLSGRSTPFELENFLHQTPDAMRCNSPSDAMVGADSLVAPPNRHMQLLMRDLNSPSATARIRAMRALNSVSKRNTYGMFDVSYAEQDIITDEERLAGREEKRTIEEIMRDVCVYVEVRSGTDNRSDGIKEHIASLGAKVNERLLKDTTHVIFKDGLLSTYQKAKKMNIPVVSILWIEACKRHTCLMNPNDFKISNLERYENPDLFKRIRRQKSMQPGAEEAVGVKKRPAAATKSKAPTAPPVVSPPSKLPVLHRIRKDDRLERMLSDFEAENQLHSSNDGPIDEYDQLLQAAPMRMLERFRSTPTPMEREEDPTAMGTPIHASKAQNSVHGLTGRQLFTVHEATAKQPHQRTLTPRARRQTVMFTPQMTNVAEEEPTAARDDETPKQTAPRNRRRTIVTPVAQTTPAAARSTRRRSTIVPQDGGTGKENISPVNKQTSLVGMNTPENIPVQRGRRRTIVAAKEVEQEQPTVSASKRIRRRTVISGNEENTPPVSMDVTKTDKRAQRTICSPKDMEVSTSAIRSGDAIAHKPAGPGELTKINSSGSTINESSGSSVPPADTRRDRRRTICRTPAAERPMELETIPSTPVASESVGRRRTLFTPGSISSAMETLEVSETPPDPSYGSSIVNRPNPTSSSTPNPLQAAPPSANRRKTLLEQYEESIIFSSKRAPDRRRRTVFDITMDIMDHRLAEINRQATAKASAAAKASDEPPPPPGVPGSLFERALKSPPVQTHLDAYYRKAAKSCEKSTNAPEPATVKATEESGEAVVAPRKRKLFTVQPLEEDLLVATRKTPVATAPRRRSLAPVAPAVAAPGEASRKRRPNIPPNAIDEPAHDKQDKRQIYPVGRGLPTMVASQRQATGLPAQYLATTNLHTEQSAFVKEAIGTLSGFTIETNVTDRTTHLVTLESRRTVNLLRALIRGIWIVRYEWIVESYRAGHWLPEERYELHDFSRAVQLNRSERQAFGSRYSNDLFADFAPFWISPRSIVPVEQLRELIVLCRGKVTGTASRAKFLVVQPDDNDAAPLEGQVVVTSLWVLDSITINRVKKLTKKYRVE
uniref:BRCT domain-containing protein n=1 Tax=Anopheles farauti TaxID=69004 RepID=A0A182QA69_9DIPT